MINHKNATPQLEGFDLMINHKNATPQLEGFDLDSRKLLRDLLKELRKFHYYPR